MLFTLLPFRTFSLSPALTERGEAFWLIMLILLLGVGGMVLIALLMTAWRRHNRRNAFRRKHEPMADLWQAGGDRLGSSIDNRRARPDAHEDDEDEEPPATPPEQPTP